MSFEDYLEARKLHLMVAVVYNGGGFSPLLRLLRQKKVSIIGLLQRLVADIGSGAVLRAGNLRFVCPINKRRTVELGRGA